MTTTQPTGPSAERDGWRLRLYVAGQTPRSQAAFANLKRVCETYAPGRYEIEVIDLTRDPQLAAVEQIVALPTLVRRLPTPIRRIIGDLSNTERVLVALDMQPRLDGGGKLEAGR